MIIFMLMTIHIWLSCSFRLELMCHALVLTNILVMNTVHLLEIK
jgi:hypothetical protein